MLPHFMFVSCITSSSSRFPSYSITSEFVSLLPVLAGHKEFDPGPLSLETEPSSMWCWELLDPFWLPFRVTCARRTRRLLCTPSSDTTRKTKHMAPMFLFPNTVYSICAAGPCLLHIHSMTESCVQWVMANLHTWSCHQKPLNSLHVSVALTVQLQSLLNVLSPASTHGLHTSRC